MSKIADRSKFYPSSFTLTFAIEVLGIDVWHDCNEGWLDLGPCVQGMKIQYQLYPGQSFDVDVLIWPHTAKIWCNSSQCGWVRTWQFLERRWLSFSVTHIFPVRVVELRNFVATIKPNIGIGSLGAKAKSDKNVEVYLPELTFGQKRYFAPVVESEESIRQYIKNLIWKPLLEYMPTSYLDGPFDLPQPVTDKRHQDAILYHVKETILNESRKVISLAAEQPRSKAAFNASKGNKSDKNASFEIKLSGDTLLSGAGRIVRFECSGERPPEIGEIITLISSKNMPAMDDLPIFFVNVDNLSGIPVKELKKLGTTSIYIKWVFADEEHVSEPIALPDNEDSINVNDHHAIPLAIDTASAKMSTLEGHPFDIELRGIRPSAPTSKAPTLFGYDKEDPDYGVVPAKIQTKKTTEDLDFIIALARIDAAAIAKGLNGLIREDFSLYPPITIVERSRSFNCTNDINAIRSPVKPNLVVKPWIVLESSLSMEVSVGLVGCRFHRLTSCFSRLFALVDDTQTIMTLLKQIGDIECDLIKSNRWDQILTGYALETGDVVFLYVEGPRDGVILKIWETVLVNCQHCKASFSTSSRYPNRLYPANPAPGRRPADEQCHRMPREGILVAPFLILKMAVPLSSILACPQIYARPALPLPARSALLKFDRIIYGRLEDAPGSHEMPTPEELSSFRLELCAPPRSDAGIYNSLFIIKSPRN